MQVPLTEQQPADQRGQLARSCIPGIVPHHRPALCRECRRIFLQCVLNLLDKFLCAVVETEAGRLQIFVKRRDHHRFSCGQIFTYFDRASIAGEGVTNAPGQNTYVELPDVSWEVVVWLRTQEVNIG